jgi:hypothetical protein
MKITLNELRHLVKSVIREEMEKSGEELDRYSSYNNYINERLMAYADENGEDYSKMKSYFMNEADPQNMKSQKEAKNAYFEIVNDFLSKKGY